MSVYFIHSFIRSFVHSLSLRVFVGVYCRHSLPGYAFYTFAP